MTSAPILKEICSFAHTLKQTGKHIKQLAAGFLLLVFAIALTPFDFFHHHPQQTGQSCSQGEVKCMHKEHIKSSADNCLICALHFEKTYCSSQHYFQVFLVKKATSPHFYQTISCYTELIGTSLRGPPLS